MGEKACRVAARDRSMRRYWTAALLLPAGLALLLLPPLACHADAARLVCGFPAVAG